MTTIRNCLLAAAGLITAATSGPLLAVNFMGENFSCESAGDALADAIQAHQAPESAGLVPMLENLIYLLQRAIGVLDSNCQGSSGYSTTRAELVNSLNQARTTCSQVSSSGSCSAKPYNGAY